MLCLSVIDFTRFNIIATIPNLKFQEKEGVGWAWGFDLLFSHDPGKGAARKARFQIFLTFFIF